MLNVSLERKESIKTEMTTIYVNNNNKKNIKYRNCKLDVKVGPPLHHSQIKII